MKPGETNRIEHKSSLTREMDMEKEVVAFLNYREGGLVYVGIDKTGRWLALNHLFNQITTPNSTEDDSAFNW